MMSAHQNLETEKSGSKAGRKRFIIILIVILVIIFLAQALLFYIQKGESRRILKEAKSIQLAVRMISAEYYGLDKQFYNPVSSDGFAEGVAAELSDVSGCSGNIYLIAWDEDSHIPVRLEYIKDGYVVDYVRVGEKDVWNVYKFEHVIVQ